MDALNDILNRSLYEELEARSEQLSTNKKMSWYQLSYPLFKNQPLESIDDLWRLIAYAYAWMPTIPSVNSDLINNESVLLKKLIQLQNGNLDEKESIVEELVPVINNSVVGLSKVLHFVSPDFVPIIDSRVLKGWRSFFDKHTPKDKRLSLPKSINSSNQIKTYLKYWDLINLWSCNSGESLRKIEVSLFNLVGQG